MSGTDVTSALHSGSAGTSVDEVVVEVGNQKETNFYLCPEDDPDLLVGIQALGLLCVTYNNWKVMRGALEDSQPSSSIFDRLFCGLSAEEETVKSPEEINKDAKDIESDWVHNANIISYTLWNEEYKPLFGETRLLSQCVTGLMRMHLDPKSDAITIMPFIAFRGSMSNVDWARDALSLIQATHKSEGGKTFSKSSSKETSVGYGFDAMYRNLRELKRTFEADDDSEVTRSLMQEVLYLMKLYDNRLLISGHSLGGGCSNIFLLELLLDYPELVTDKILMVTFGSPRAVGKNIAEKFDSLPVRHLRFCNNDDIITSLSPAKQELYFHAGKSFFPYLPTRVADLDKHGLTKSLPDWIDLPKKGESPLSEQQLKVYEEHQRSRWLVAYDPKKHDNTHPCYNFSADPRADATVDNWMNKFAKAKGYRKNPKVHDIVDPKGYVIHFVHYPKNSRISETGQMYLDKEAAMVKKYGLANA